MSTLVLNHFNGSYGATTFTDEVPGVTWTRIPVFGPCYLDTSRVRFGATSLILGTSGDQVYASGFTSPHAGSWTVEGFFQFEGVVGGGAGFSPGCELTISNSDGTLRTGIGLFTDAYVPRLLAYGADEIGNDLFYADPATYFTEDTWYHFALVRNASAGTYSAYFNGTRFGYWNIATNTHSFVKLRTAFSGDSDYHLGWWDEVQFTNEVKYSGSTHTVPTTEFTLGSTINVETFTSEFDRSAELAPLTLNLSVESSEYDLESSETTIRLTQSDPQSQYSYESDSPALSHIHNVQVDNLESDWEVSLQQGVVTDEMEFDWEAGDVGIPIDVFIGSGQIPLELGWEASSPGFTSKNFLRGVTPHRRRIIAGRRSAFRTITPLLIIPVTASRRTDIVRV